MSKIVIKGRDYPLPDNFSFREMSLIKQHTGLRAGELGEALAYGDTDVIAAFAMIALRRSGSRIDLDDVLDMGINEIELHFGNEEQEESGDPPAEGSATAEPTSE